MKKNFVYYMPTKIISGVGSLNDIDKYIDGRRTLLVTSKGFIKRGLIDRVKSLTDNIVEVISEVQSHPEFKDLKITYNKIKDIDFELILAIGGGSVLDASKLFSVRNSTKEYQFVEDIIKGKIPKKDYRLIPIIAVPTTSGTGSEITPWATIWDMDEKKKYSLHLPNLFAQIAIYDASLTISVPKDITIQTGLDTLSHALESIWNRNANPITVDYAIKSSRLIMDYLPLLADDLDSIEYREKIMEACMYAGLAFSNTQTAIAHAMSYYITTHKGTSHGIACSFTLPMLIDGLIGKYKFIDNAFDKIFGMVSSKPLRQLLKTLDISTEFIDYGMGKDEIIRMGTNLKKETRTKNSLVTFEDLSFF